MQESEFQIPYRDGKTFFACEWSPPGEAKGLIILVHGLSEHAGRYKHVGSFFAASGYCLILADLRGHGRSFGKRGHFPSIGVIMDDISLFIEAARRRHPALPLILYGHSMGGNLVLNYLIRRNPLVSACVVTSPWLRLASPPPLIKVILANLSGKLFPALTEPDGLNPSYLSHDSEVCRTYASDPLVHSRISASTFLEISRSGKYAIKHANDIDCPLLLMHGTADKLTSYDASTEFSLKVTAPNTFKAWNGLFHELHNEFEKETVLEFISEWLASSK